MISSLFSSPISFFIAILSLVVAITIHEFSHAYAAERLGDPTPRLQDRLTLNPLRHLDMFGTLFIVLFGFGWGKPVVFDPYNLKNPRRDAAIISFAGPLSNLFLAALLAITLKLSVLFHLSWMTALGAYIFIPIISFNVMLAVFNLIPIHPLDGFKIVGGILPEDKAQEWYGLEKYGIIFLLLMILPLGNQSLLGMIVQPVISFILGFLIGYPFIST
ncbi:site-2 protease family protein [Candidatus Roizmanbacteria bacterium]|nr:site-2 protease family protein [Candidatus Roizmanbacteria bacterium]